MTSGLFWARLLTYRPLFLLGGLWFTLVCVSAIAYHGLMFNEPVDNAASPDTAAQAPLTIADSGSLNSGSLDSGSLDAGNLEAAAPATEGSGTVILWGLFSLVGLCGFGCFVLTQQIKASARPKPKKAPPRPSAKAIPPRRPPGPKRLTPYSPQRDGVLMPGVMVVEAPGPDPSRLPSPISPPPISPPQPMQPPTRSPQISSPAAFTEPSLGTVQPPRQGAVSAPAPQPRPATLVPATADLPLDWSEGSVAHALDVRQRRSLSSFM